MPPLPSIPPWDMVEPLLRYAMVPAFVAAAAVTAAVLLIAGKKQATLATVLGVVVSVGLGLWLPRAMTPADGELTWLMPADALEFLRQTLTLSNGESTWNRLPWAALAALWMGRVARMPNVPPAAGWFLRVGASAGTAWFVISPLTRKEVEWLAPAFAAVILAQWVLLERLCVAGQDMPDQPKKAGQAQPDLQENPVGGGSVPFFIALTFFAAGVVLIHVNWARLMEASMVLACAFAGIAVVAALFRIDAGGAVPAAAVLLPGLVLMAEQEMAALTPNMPWEAFPLAGLAPLILVEALPFNHRRGFLWTLLRFAFVLIPLAGAIWLALYAGPLEYD